jgi:xylan 1,4-beta-xylosidase
VGYGANDVYTDYLKLGSPPTLSRGQVRLLAGRNDGRPVSTALVNVGASGEFTRSLPLRENDVYLLTLLPQSRTKQ